MMKRRMKWLLAAVSLLTAEVAWAHMPYVVPSLFDVGTRDLVTVEASFTEDVFRPEFAMRDAPFEMTGPDGATTRLGNPTLLTEMSIVEAKLPADGIYRISSGQRVGRMGHMYRAGDAWQMVGEGVVAPPGAALVDVRSMTLADVYVIRGKPAGNGALAPREKLLEIHPLGDPTAITMSDPAAFEILQDGKPVVGAEVSLFREAGFYDGRKVAATLKSDAGGKVRVTLPDPGRYLLMVRNRVATSPGDAAPFISYTVTLALEAS